MRFALFIVVFLLAASFAQADLFDRLKTRIQRAASLLQQGSGCTGPDVDEHGAHDEPMLVLECVTPESTADTRRAVGTVRWQEAFGGNPYFSSPSYVQDLQDAVTGTGIRYDQYQFYVNSAESAQVTFSCDPTTGTVTVGANDHVVVTYQEAPTVLSQWVNTWRTEIPLDVDVGAPFGAALYRAANQDIDNQAPSLDINLLYLKKALILGSQLLTYGDKYIYC